MLYCTDADLLAWEPDLPAAAAFAAQTLVTGTATLAGTQIDAADVDFTAAGVAAGMIVVLSGDVSGCFPVLGVELPTRLVVSTNVAVSSEHDEAVPPISSARPVGTSPAVSFAVRTYSPQRQIVSRLIESAASLQPGEAIVNAADLKHAAVLGTLQMIYNALAAAGGETAREWAVRGEVYARLYRRALSSAVVHIDTNGDGRADLRRWLGWTRLYRV